MFRFDWGQLLGSIGGVIAVCASLTVLFMIVRSGSGYNVSYTNLKMDSSPIRPSVIGRQITFFGGGSATLGFRTFF